jgi:SAM-dependent methyltransferase
MLDVARRQYADAWAGNAVHYEAQGLYRRLARLLFDQGSPARIVDLGCGRGEGMASLYEAERSPCEYLIGVDENPECLAAAAIRIGPRLSCPPVTRMAHRILSGRGFALEYIPGRLSGPCPPVGLLQSDLLREDTELEALLDEAGVFDAITLWFTGIHKAREHDVVVRQRNLISDGLHEVAVEFATLRLAIRHLRAEGLVQIVGRAAHVDPSAIDRAFRNKMATMIDGLPLSLIDLQLIPYHEPVTGKRLAVGSLEFDACLVPTTAVSMILRRH